MSHFRHTVAAKDLDEAIHRHLVDGKIVVPVPAKLTIVGVGELKPTEYTLLIYDPKKFEKEREAQIEERYQSGLFPQGKS